MTTYLDHPQIIGRCLWSSTKTLSSSHVICLRFGTLRENCRGENHSKTNYTRLRCRLLERFVRRIKWVWFTEE
jgi:hypothetical protein